MIVRRLAVLGLASAALLMLPSEAWAQRLRVIETGPANGATIESQGTGFFVRFDKPVDHIRSILEIKRGDKIVQTLHPRLKAAPEVLFAQAMALEPGDYTFHWLVNRLDGGEIEEGQIAFSVSAGRRPTN